MSLFVPFLTNALHALSNETVGIIGVSLHFFDRE